MRTASKEIAISVKDIEVNTVADKLGATISFLRAAERGDVVAQIRSAQRYSHLATIVDTTNAFLRESPSLQAVRDHVVELASTDMTEKNPTVEIITQR